MPPIQLEEPPAGFEITQDWQRMPDNVRQWARPLWNAVSGEPTTKRVPFVCGKRTGKLRKSWGKGNSRGTFVFMEMERFTVAINFKTLSIRIN
jgi:hypothetical protein